MTIPPTDQVKLLLVEDNPGDARLLQRLLEETAGSRFVVDWVDRLAGGLERLSRGDVDLVLLDLDLPDSAGLQTFQRVREQCPDVPIILLTGRQDEELALQAVSEGAQEYLVKGSIDGPSLSRHIRHAIGRHRSLRSQLAGSDKPQAGRVLGFLGAKGGVGTTTLVLNIAAALAGQKRQVIVAELLTGHGSCSILTRQTPTLHLGCLLDPQSASIDRHILNAHLVLVPFGFKILFAPTQISDSSDIEPARAEAILTGLASLAGFTLVDFQNGDNVLLKPAVRACEFMLIVLEPEPIAMQAARSALSLLDSYGAKAESIGLIIVNRAALSSGMMLAEARSQLGCKIIGVVPPAADSFAAAHKAGKLLMLTYPESKAASAIAEIAGRLCEQPVGTLNA